MAAQDTLVSGLRGWPPARNSYLVLRPVVDGHLGHGAASRRARAWGGSGPQRPALKLARRGPLRPFPHHSSRDRVRGAGLPIEWSIGRAVRARPGSPRTTRKSASWWNIRA